MIVRSSRSVFPILAVAALLAPGSSASAGSPAPDPQRAMIEEVVRDYLLAHPEIVLEAQQRARDEARRQAIADNRLALETPYRGAAIGPADASVTIVEFMDYGCHFCRDTAPEIKKLMAGDAGVRLVLRQYPILSELSAQAARVALLAAENGDFQAYHDALYAQPDLTTQAVLDAAAAAGLNAEAAKVAAFDTSRDGEFASNERLGAAIGASGTPTFLIGNTIISGAMRRDELAAAVAQARRDQSGEAR